MTATSSAARSQSKAALAIIPANRDLVERVFGKLKRARGLAT